MRTLENVCLVVNLLGMVAWLVMSRDSPSLAGKLVQIALAFVLAFNFVRWVR